MKIVVTLSNSGGELDSSIIDLPDGTDPDDGTDQIHAIIEPWILSVGDTITIREA